MLEKISFQDQTVENLISIHCAKFGQWLVEVLSLRRNEALFIKAVKISAVAFLVLVCVGLAPFTLGLSVVLPLYCLYKEGRFKKKSRIDLPVLRSQASSACQIPKYGISNPQRVSCHIGSVLMALFHLRHLFHHIAHLPGIQAIMESYENTDPDKLKGYYVKIAEGLPQWIPELDFNSTGRPAENLKSILKAICLESREISSFFEFTIGSCICSKCKNIINEEKKTVGVFWPMVNLATTLEDAMAELSNHGALCKPQCKDAECRKDRSGRNNNRTSAPALPKYFYLSSNCYSIPLQGKFTYQGKSFGVLAAIQSGGHSTAVLPDQLDRSQTWYEYDDGKEKKSLADRGSYPLFLIENLSV